MQFGGPRRAALAQRSGHQERHDIRDRRSVCDDTARPVGASVRWYFWKVDDASATADTSRRRHDLGKLDADENWQVESSRESAKKGGGFEEGAHCKGLHTSESFGRSDNHTRSCWAHGGGRREDGSSVRSMVKSQNAPSHTWMSGPKGLPPERCISTLVSRVSRWALELRAQKCCFWLAITLTVLSYVSTIDAAANPSIPVNTAAGNNPGSQELVLATWNPQKLRELQEVILFFHFASL